jgi:hypothetical protein
MANTIPQGSQPLSATATGTSGTLVATLGSNSNIGRGVYCSGFSYQSTGATAASQVTITISYAPAANGTAIVLGTWNYPITTGVTTLQVPFEINLIPPVGSFMPITGVTNGATGTPTGSVSITTTTNGAGATLCAANIWGYML